MNKKDRIAVVLTVIYALVPLFFVGGGKGLAGFLLLVPIVMYWGYRFVRNDISFFKVKEPD